MKLEEQVATLELCEQLPEDAFADSAFVWYYPYNEGSQWDLIPRSEAGKEPMYAAPTLQEIVSELTPGEDGCGEITQFGKDKRGWFMMASFEGNDDGYGSGIDTYEEKDDANPATAALKLWLDLTKGGKDGK